MQTIIKTSRKDLFVPPILNCVKFCLFLGAAYQKVKDNKSEEKLVCTICEHMHCWKYNFIKN